MKQIFYITVQKQLISANSFMRFSVVPDTLEQANKDLGTMVSICKSDKDVSLISIERSGTSKPVKSWSPSKGYFVPKQ